MIVFNGQLLENIIHKKKSELNSTIDPIDFTDVSRNSTSKNVHFSQLHREYSPARLPY